MPPPPWTRLPRPATAALALPFLPPSRQQLPSLPLRPQPQPLPLRPHPQPASVESTTMSSPQPQPASTVEEATMSSPQPQPSIDAAGATDWLFIRENKPLPRVWLQAEPLWLSRKAMPRLSPSLRTSPDDGVRPLGAWHPQSPESGVQSAPPPWIAPSQPQPDAPPPIPVCNAQPVVASAKIIKAENSMDFIVSNPFEIWVCSVVT